eukprot:236035-Rhodomonas_salina.4
MRRRLRQLLTLADSAPAPANPSQTWPGRVEHHGVENDLVWNYHTRALTPADPSPPRTGPQPLVT